MPWSTSLLVVLLVTVWLPGCSSDETPTGQENPLLSGSTISVTTARSVPVTVRVLTSATDTNGSRLTITSVTPGLHGTTVRNVNDTVTYTPAMGFDGSDQFTYTSSNGQGTVSTGTVTVQVLPADGFVLSGLLRTVTVIDDPVFNQANGINDAGDIVGVKACGDFCGYRLTQGTMVNLGPTVFPRSLNNAGQMVGALATCFAFGMPLPLHGFLLENQSTTPRLIDFPGVSVSGFCSPNDDATFVEGINDTGQMVGAVRLQNVWHGFFRDSAGTFTLLDVPGASSTQAFGINNSGAIVGMFPDANMIAHGFLQAPQGALTVLDAPGAARDPSIFGEPVGTVAAGINTKGEVVGQVLDSNGVVRGFLWQSGTFSLFDIPGAIYTTAGGINNTAQIVGSFRVSLGSASAGSRAKGYIATPVDGGAAASFDGP